MILPALDAFMSIFGLTRADDPDRGHPCCWTCTPHYDRMLTCPTCGNKRCPHASNHEHACTNSNEPGQAGSVYGGGYDPTAGREPCPGPCAGVDCARCDGSGLVTVRK